MPAVDLNVVLTLDEITYLRVLLKTEFTTQLFDILRGARQLKSDQELLTPLTQIVTTQEVFKVLDLPLSYIQDEMTETKQADVEIPLTEEVFKLFNGVIRNPLVKALVQNGPRDRLEAVMYALSKKLLPGLLVKFDALEAKLATADSNVAETPITFTLPVNRSVN